MSFTVADVSQMTKKNVLDAEEVIFLLKRRGYTQAKLAAELSVAPSIVNNVIHGRSTCFSIAQYIADLLECSVHQLWPNKYVFKPRASRINPQNQLHQGEKP